MKKYFLNIILLSLIINLNSDELDHIKENFDLKAMYNRELVVKKNLSEVEIAKFYQSQGFYLAGIKRYKKVISEFKKSIHIPEAIFRLIECYTSLGLSKQAIYLYKILEYNFKKTVWVKEAKGLVIKNANFVNE